MAKKRRRYVSREGSANPSPARGEGNRERLPAAHRRAAIQRKTKETEIKLSLDLDGTGGAAIASGIGFFDHMLNTLSKHSAIDLELRCRGDTQVDDHHTVEDVGLVLGAAVQQALGGKAGIRRFGFGSVPLDEALAQVTVDLSGRACFVLAGRQRLGKGKVGAFDVELLEDFLKAFANASGTTLHVELKAGRNGHHIIEAVMKALARALRQAVEYDCRTRDVPSTKGSL